MRIIGCDKFTSGRILNVKNVSAFRQPQHDRANAERPSRPSCRVGDFAAQPRRRRRRNRKSAAAAQATVPLIRRSIRRKPDNHIKAELDRIRPFELESAFSAEQLRHDDAGSSSEATTPTTTTTTTTTAAAALETQQRDLRAEQRRAELAGNTSERRQEERHAARALDVTPATLSSHQQS